MGIAFALTLAAAAAAKATPAPTTLQGQFDAANQAVVERRCAEALAGYAAIEHAPGIARNRLATATIAVRKGKCLVRTGRGAEGEAAIRSGLPMLQANSAEFHDDIRDARLALATAARLRFDYDAAIAETEAALAMSSGLSRAGPLQELAAMTMFDGDGRALRYAEEARAVVAAAPDASKTEVAAVQTTTARVLLNRGQFKDAYALLRDSLAKQGGLDLRIGIDEVATRSDLAIAALLTGDKDRAREFLAYTGAGRIADAPFGRAESMEPPACDPGIGLKPEDVAVVEFALAEDGRVLAARTIYVTGGRAAALAFGRAVAKWSWRGEEAAKVPAFYRALTRVELRCSTGADVPGIGRPLRDAATAWLSEGQGVAWDDMGDAAAAPLERTAMAAAPAGSRAQLAALFALADNVSLSDAERGTVAERATALAATLNAPPAVRAALALARLSLGEPSRTKWQAGARTLLADPALGGDPLTASTIRLFLAAPDERRNTPSDAHTLLDAVIDAPGLPPQHPLKVNALLRKANLLAAAGDAAGADATFRRAGLSAEQCAMLGVTPSMRATGAGLGSFPMEAMRWGFEGWVRTEFDIAADGRTLAPRALIAYPPFVFDDAATGISRASRWSSSYRPTGSVACAASHQAIRFVMPAHAGG